MAISKPRRSATRKPGLRLKALRLQNGWTLADVAERTGLPISTLSRLENGKIAMTYEKLLELSAGLQIDMNVLVADAPGQPIPRDGGYRRAIVRAGEGLPVETETGVYRYVATDLLHKKITPIIGDVYARSISEFDDYLHHAGEEYLFVLSGTLELHTETYAPVRLEKGDSIYFDSSMGHAYVAVGDEPCQVLSLCANDTDQPLEYHALQATPANATGNPAPTSRRVPTSAELPSQVRRIRNARRKP